MYGTPEAGESVVRQDDECVGFTHLVECLADECVHADVAIVDDFGVAVALFRVAPGVAGVAVAPEDV